MKKTFKKHISYYLIQQKTAFYHIPKLLLCILCFALIFAGFSFAGSTLLYSSNERSTKVDIALVAEDDDPLIDLALTYINNLDSVDAVCNFFVTDRKTALTELANSNIYAMVTLPEDFIANIYNGLNTPAQILLQENAGADIILFETLANAAAYTLRTAQSGIYATIDILEEFELQSSRRTIINDLNKQYISFALKRSNLFNEEAVSATNTLSVATFYGACAAVFLLVISCIGCYSFCKDNTSQISILVNRYGIKFPMQVILQCFALSVCYLIIFLIPFLLYEFVILEETVFAVFFKALPLFFLLIFSICAFSLFLFKAASTPQTGILLLFALSIIMMFLSGGILPSAFLPTVVRYVGNRLPTAGWLNTAFCLATGEINLIYILPVAGFAILFILINSLISRLETR